MKYYFEMVEKSEDLDIEPQCVGPIYVSDIDEAKTIMSAALVDFSGLEYKAQYVTCRHEENLPCIAQELKESDL